MKKVITKLNPLIIFFLIISTIILLVYSLGSSNPNGVIRYFSFLYSAVNLVIVLMNMGRLWRFIKKVFSNSNFYLNTKNKLYKNKYIEKYFEDIKYKNIINLTFSFIFNFVFIGLKLSDGIINKSVWFISLSLYYLLLTITKFFLLINLRKYKKEKEYRIYCNVGYFIMLINIVLIVMIVQMVRTNVAIVYGGYIIYMTAFYTFYLIISAIVNLFKYRKYKSPILSSVKIINLLTSSVSLLMLQTTMIATFSQNDLEFMKLMNTVTGSIIAIIIMIISTYMIIKGQKELRKIDGYSND